MTIQGYPGSRPEKVRWCLGTAVAFLTVTSTSAFSLRYEAFDRPDVNPGEDLWEARLTVGDAVFNPDDGFTVYFDSASYGLLSGPLPPVPVGWDLLLIQADPGLSLPGFLDGLAIVNDAPTADPFLLDFVWLGPGQPRSVEFEHYTLNGGFQILDSGTAPNSAIPEAYPGGMATWAGLSSLAFLHWRRRR